MASPESRRRLHQIVGDAELGIIAIDKALDVAMALSGRYRASVSLPALIPQQRGLIESLRNHYAHIDARAMGEAKGKLDPAAVEATYHFGAIVREHRFTDGVRSISIGAEMTELLVATRGYIVGVLVEIVERANREGA